MQWIDNITLPGVTLDPTTQILLVSRNTYNPPGKMNHNYISKTSRS